MKIIEPYIEVYPFEPIKILKNIEHYARTAYKSGVKTTDNSYVGFIQRIIKSGHESVIEHEKITVKFVVDRGISHEIVRHRIAAYSQESTRYCNYSGERFGNEITVIRPFFFDESLMKFWETACHNSQQVYLALLKYGASPQEARSVLPNSLKTEIVATYNLREWRHFFRLRADKAAHPQIKQVAIPLLLYLKGKLPVVFDDIEYDENLAISNYAKVKEVSLS